MESSLTPGSGFTPGATTTIGPSNWMLYGASGVTGRKILAEALRRGHRPILAGRDRSQLDKLARSTGLTVRTLSLEDPATLRAALSDVQLVLHAAGPFRVTGPVMRSACLDARCSYLDINGEIGDFGAALAADVKARAAGIAIVPGVGYGVVFGETLAAYVTQRLPDIEHLRLSLATDVETRSRGARLSVALAVRDGGREIIRGELRRRPLGSSSWRVPGSGAPTIGFASAPLGELLAVHRSTRIPNIVAGIPLPPAAVIAFRIAGPLLGRLMTRQARRALPAVESGRTVQAISARRSRVWAEASNATGARVTAKLETGEGYETAAAVAVRAVELQLIQRRTGAFTPVEAYGTSLALSVPSTTIADLPPSRSA